MRNLSSVLLILFFALVMAYGIYALANFQPDFYWMPIGILGFVFSILWAALFKGMIRDRRILRLGEPATATVLRMSATGVYVNHNPQLKLEIEVTPTRGSTYTTTTKIVASRLNPMAYGPGTVLPIKIDPSDPLMVAVDKQAMRNPAQARQGAFPFAQANAQRLAAMQELLAPVAQTQADLMANGLDGEGTIVSLWSLDAQYGAAAAAMAFLVDVRIPGKASFRTEIKCMVPNAEIGNHVVGARVALKYDPADPQSRITMAGLLPG